MKWNLCDFYLVFWLVYFISEAFFPGLERVFCTNIVAITPVLVVGIPVLEGLERQHHFRGHNPSRSSSLGCKITFYFLSNVLLL
jgi:hypothetical protein